MTQQFCCHVNPNEKTERRTERVPGTPAKGHKRTAPGRRSVLERGLGAASPVQESEDPSSPFSWKQLCDAIASRQVVISIILQLAPVASVIHPRSTSSRSIARIVAAWRQGCRGKTRPLALGIAYRLTLRTTKRSKTGGKIGVNDSRAAVLSICSVLAPRCQHHRRLPESAAHQARRQGHRIVGSLGADGAPPTSYSASQLRDPPIDGRSRGWDLLACAFYSILGGRSVLAICKKCEA